MFRPMIRSRHGSHDNLRSMLPKFPFRSVIRLGSTTEIEDTIAKGGKRIEVNTVEAIRNSASKLRMKECFSKGNVKTAKWFKITNDLNTAELPYPIVAKHIFGSRGTGNTLIESESEFKNWLKGKTPENYILERYMSYVREYRLHVTKDGCFYTCRKMLKSDTPDDERWYRNDSNSVWITEENEKFDKPTNWKDIEAECIKGLQATGLDFGAFDVKVQSAKENKTPDFFIIEVNSAPSFGDITLEKYLEQLPKILNDKYNEIKNF